MACENIINSAGLKNNNRQHRHLDGLQIVSFEALKQLIFNLNYINIIWVSVCIAKDYHQTSIWAGNPGGFYSGILFFLLLMSSPALSSKNTAFKQLPNEENLASNYINKIIQRQDGFIWMATADGISRFDGKNFINHKSFPDNPKSLPNPWVNYLLEDHNKQLWVGTATGLAKMLPDEVSFAQYMFDPNDEQSIAGNSIVHIFEDSEHRLWFATDRGLSLFLPERNEFNNFYIDSDVSDIKTNNINAIAQKNAHQLWIGNDQGLHVFDIKTAEFTPYIIETTDTTNFEVLDLASDSQGQLWVVTAFQGLKKLNTSNNEVISYHHQPDGHNSIISDGLWSIFIDTSDNAWIASWGEGVSQISAADGKITNYVHNYGDVRSIPSNLTTDVFQDNTGLIWISTYDGVALLDPNNTVESIRPVPGKQNTLSSDLVWAFEETEAALWVGTTEGINRWDKSSGLIERYYSTYGGDNSQEFTAVWSMAKANEQTFWMGTEFGLAQFDTQSKKLSYLSESPIHRNNIAAIKLLENSVWTITQNSDQSVWVGTNMAHLYQVDKDLNLLKDYSELIQSTLAKYDNVEFTNITQDADNNLWLSTASGLFFLDVANALIAPVRSAQGEILFDNDWIYVFEKHQGNQYWISSQYHGLSLFQLNSNGSMDRILHYDYSHPDIVDRSIHNIYPTNEFEVWFTGRKNLYHLNLSRNEITNFGSSYFESSLIFHEKSQFYSTENMLYLGSNRGAIRFDPEQISKSNYQPKVYFTGIQSNSMSIATAAEDPFLEPFKGNQTTVKNAVPVHQIKDHVFNYSDSIFTFQFSALDYMHAEDLKYAYRLPELDENWVELQNRNELTLSNLSAGDYQLEVRATNADLQWSEHTAAINFTLLPKPWLTWWAKSLYTLIAVLIAFIIIRLYRSRLLTQYALEHREVQLSQAIWGSGDELWEWDIRKQEIIRTNNAELDNNRRRFFNGSFTSNTLDIHPDDIHQLKNKIQDILSGKSAEFDAVYRQMNNQGAWQWMQDRAKVTQWSGNHKPLVVNGISRNINTIKKKEQRSQLIASAFQSSSDGALVLDVSLKVISINAAFTDITGYDERIIDNFIQTDSDRISTNKMDSTALFEHIISGITINGAYRNEISILTVTEEKLAIDLRVNCIYNAQNEPTHYIATLTDITYRKDTEQALKRLANYDNLTGLPNRSLMMVQLNKALDQAERTQQQMAIMFVDLDHFKNINDSLGHTIGDELLVAVSERLKKCVRKSDTIARIGGDEFTIGILGFDNTSHVTELAEKILRKMSKPFQLENHELIITPSIGISIYNGNKTDIETLLMQADTAMYQAKRKGRNNYRYFTDSMNQAVQQRVSIEMRLRKALQNNEMVLHYQPKFSLVTGQITGFEALLRWQGADLISTPPDEFIPIAEETGLIFSIGAFVLESACHQLNQWHINGFNKIHLAINLSAVQFLDKKLVWRVAQMIKKYDIPPFTLEIEITESTLIENLQYAVKTLHELRRLGVKISLDDFGTGFSSLNYLKQFPIHALKIDRSFILDMVNDSRDANMVESIILLAHKLSIEVIAEGVETTDQLKLLASYNIEEVQGFLLSKAIEPEAVDDMLKQGQTVSSILNQ